MQPPATQTPPSLELVWENLMGFQRSAAMRAAIELDLFTAVAQGHTDVPSLARACQASERGIRILCDYMVVQRMLTKSGGTYSLTPESQTFLSKTSPGYVGSAIGFMLLPSVVEGFATLTDAVRQGTTQLPGHEMAHEHPMWRAFAEAMGPMARMPAKMIAERLAPRSGACKVLDVAAGHGWYGIAFAQVNPQAQIFGLDWPGVLEAAKKNAADTGVSDRYHTITGSAFNVDFGGPYDLVLLTNFLHHFDQATNVKLLAKARQALTPGGKVAVLEFVPSPDRTSPPPAAMFPLTMLVNTERGDAYTADEYRTMFAAAGFREPEFTPLPPTPQTLVVASPE